MSLETIVAPLSARYVSLKSCTLTVWDALADNNYDVGEPESVENSYLRGRIDIPAIERREGGIVGIVRILWARSVGSGCVECTIDVE